MNRLIIQEAAEWFVEIDTGDADATVRRRFDSWLRASPEHIRAFLEILPLWQDGAQLPLDPAVTADSLIEWARSASDTACIQLPLRPGSAAPGTPAPSTYLPRTRWRLRMAAVVAALAVGIAATLGYRALQYPTYVTGIGEQRSLTLADGSAIELNARSKIRVHFNANRRGVQLIEGQALFHVAHDTQRPFIVYSGLTQVRAVGTQFDVYRKSASTVVTVLEGRITVTPPPADRPGLDRPAGGATDAARDGASPRAVLSSAPDGGSAPLLVGAGHQVTVSGDTVVTSDHPDLASATAWTQHELVFDRVALSAVAEEFNRYNVRPLIVDPGLGDVTISGIFASTDPVSLIRFLREQSGVKIVESPQSIRISRQ